MNYGMRLWEERRGIFRCEICDKVMDLKRKHWTRMLFGKKHYICSKTCIANNALENCYKGLLKEEKQ